MACENMEHIKDNPLAQDLESLVKREFSHKFPYEDCRKLQKLYPDRFPELTADLNSYFMFIAGYSSSATKLSHRPDAEIRAALPKLSHSFYDVFPRYEPLAQHITDDNTPSLFHDLELADRLRLGLASLMTELLESTR